MCQKVVPAMWRPRVVESENEAEADCSVGSAVAVILSVGIVAALAALGSFRVGDNRRIELRDADEVFAFADILFHAIGLFM